MSQENSENIVYVMNNSMIKIKNIIYYNKKAERVLPHVLGLRAMVALPYLRLVTPSSVSR